MAKVTPNIAGLQVAGIITKKTAINPNKSIMGETSTFAGLDPTYTPGGTQRSTPADKYASRNAGSMKVFTNESKRPGTDNTDHPFYAHIA